MLNRKKIKVLYRILLVLIIFAISVNLIRYVLSKYKSSGESTGDVGIAYYLLEDTQISEGIALKNGEENLRPGDSITYEFSISNFKDDKVAEVAMEYDLNIIATTNLPLTYKLTVNEKEKNFENVNEIEILDNTKIIPYRDNYNTWFKKFELTNKQFLLKEENNGFKPNSQTHYYKLEIVFPEGIENSSKYQDSIEYLEININSRQIN